VELDAAVGLVLSAGADLPSCADAVGGPGDAAIALFEPTSLTVATSERNSPIVPEGNVIDCTIADDTVNLVLSGGPLERPCATLVGMTGDAAKAQLEASGYNVTIVEQASAEGDEGDVIECQATGPDVTLTVAGENPAPLTCPDVAGQTAAAATIALQELGATSVETVGQSSDTVADGLVISCAITGTVATLTVSTGPMPGDDMVTVPDVSGKTVAAATADLQAADLRVAGSNQVPSNEPAGTVIGTAPGAGVEVPEGTAVTLQVSEGPSQTLVTVPDVVGRREPGARTILERDGFVVVIEEQEGAAPDEVGRVLSTQPGAGAEVPEGSTIIIVVGAP
ncbi:MAG: PASTA domain-containing protein, partial [Actinomycetota bacterium]